MYGQGLNTAAPGKGSVVAVIDTGVDYEHKDLYDNMWRNPGEIPSNGIDDDGNGYVDNVYGIDVVNGDSDPMDDHGHGTHVAGIIAMSHGNGGGVGLDYGSQIMSIKAGGKDGTFTSTNIAEAVRYAADNGADVICMAFGGEEKSSIVESVLKDAAGSAVLIASAGNDGMPTSEAADSGYKNCRNVYPAGYNFVIGVMASDNSDHIADFSNWDYAPGKGCEYELTAPGVDIYSTLPGDRYGVWRGTSMSTACVAAAAAIIRSEHSQKNKYDSRYIMGQLINASNSRTTAAPPADIDGNDTINNEDFQHMLKGLVGLEPLEAGKGDVNYDGKADMYDAVAILRLSNGDVTADKLVGEVTKNDSDIEFDIPEVDIVEDGDYKQLTFKYNTNVPFKAAVGQLKYNGSAYSSEFEDIELLRSSNEDFIYEFNPQNGKFVAYSAGNGTSGSLTVTVYHGKSGSYSVDLIIARRKIIKRFKPS